MATLPIWGTALATLPRAAVSLHRRIALLAASRQNTDDGNPFVHSRCIKLSSVSRYTVVLISVPMTSGVATADTHYVAGSPGRFCKHNSSSVRCSACNDLICSPCSTYPCQDRKKAGSRLPLLARRTNAVTACTPFSCTHTSDAAHQSVRTI